VRTSTALAAGADHAMALASGLRLAYLLTAALAVLGATGTLALANRDLSPGGG
jgi:hypothetical protein